MKLIFSTVLLQIISRIKEQKYQFYVVWEKGNQANEWKQWTLLINCWKVRRRSKTGPFSKWLSHEGSVVMTALVSLQKRTKGEALWEWEARCHVWSREASSPATGSASTVILDFLVSATVSSTFVLFINALPIPGCRVPVAVTDAGTSVVGKNTRTNTRRSKSSWDFTTGKGWKNFRTNCHNKGIEGDSYEGSQKSTVGTALRNDLCLWPECW